jgi:hypothetical protein
MQAIISSENEKTLRVGNVSVTYGTSYGTLLSIRDHARDIELVGEPRLAENFRLLVPLQGFRAHYIVGAEQTLAEQVAHEDGVELVWRGLTSARGHFDLEFRLRVTIEQDAVLFSSTVVNRTPHVVEEVVAPAFGGMSNPAEREHWKLHHNTWGGTGAEWLLYRDAKGVYLGPPETTWLLNYPAASAMPWIDLYHKEARKGVYFCCEDPQPRFSAWLAQLRPGSNYNPVSGGWPDPAVEGVPVGLTLAQIHFAHAQPGATWQSAPVAVRFHDGTWYEAARLYRRWYDGQFTVDHTGSWLDQEDAWQSTIISYPDDTIGYRFTDLPRLAKAALSADIRVLQIDGWDQGGIDRDFPHYVPDPRLGTPEELQAAIAECEQMGVRVLLFSNLMVVNIETEWYARELHRYTMRDIRGHEQDTMGWEYNTFSGLTAHTKPRMRQANPAHPPFGQIMQDAYERMAALGAAGTQVDKVAGGYGMDGHPELRHLEPSLSGTQPIVEAFARHLEGCRKIRPDWCIAAETHWDRLLPYAHASYARHWNEDALQTLAVTFPEYRQTCCVTGASDFALICNCLRQGHIINLEARHLHGSADDVPLMRDFVRDALGLRRRLWDVLWMSRIIDPKPRVRVEADAKVKYCLHESRTRQGMFALVLNHFAAEPLAATITMEGVTTATAHSVRGEPRRITLPSTMDVPAGDCLVIVPEDGTPPTIDT